MEAVPSALRLLCRTIAIATIDTIARPARLPTRKELTVDVVVSLWRCSMRATEDALARTKDMGGAGGDGGKMTRPCIVRRTVRRNKVGAAST